MVSRAIGATVNIYNYSTRLRKTCYSPCQKMYFFNKLYKVNIRDLVISVKHAFPKEGVPCMNNKQDPNYEFKKIKSPIVLIVSIIIIISFLSGLGRGPEATTPIVIN